MNSKRSFFEVWNSTNFSCVSVLNDAHKNVVSCLLFHKSKVSSIIIDYFQSILIFTYQSKLYSSSWDGTIKVWNTTTWKLEKTVTAHTEVSFLCNELPRWYTKTFLFVLQAVSCMLIHGDYIISGSWDQTIKVRDSISNLSSFGTKLGFCRFTTLRPSKRYQSCLDT